MGGLVYTQENVIVILSIVIIMVFIVSMITVISVLASRWRFTTGHRGELTHPEHLSEIPEDGPMTVWSIDGTYTQLDT